MAFDRKTLPLHTSHSTDGARGSSATRVAISSTRPQRSWRVRAACLVLAGLIWLPSLELVFHTTRDDVVAPLTAAQLAAWAPPGADLEPLRRTNPEWDLMARTFAVLAFANLSVDDGRHLATIDRIIDETLALEAEHGHRYFLLAYAGRAPFVDREQRSVFVDGELALMLAARQLVRDDPGRAAQLRARIARIVGALERAPALVAESYPDEVWLFCNAVALAAIKLSDITARTDHSALIGRWLASVRARFVDPTTGLIVAKATYRDAVHLDGPEGSTIWLVADMLRVLDPAFAREQYALARAELAGGALGFAWAREWPASWRGPDDVDSGPTIPLVGANAGASGLALVGAAAFGDEGYLHGLLASLAFAGFPSESRGQLRFAAGNQLADAVILYALTTGPLWQRALERSTRASASTTARPPAQAGIGRGAAHGRAVTGAATPRGQAAIDAASRAPRGGVA